MRKMIARFCAVILILLILTSLCSCDKESDYRAEIFFALDTIITVKVAGDDNAEADIEDAIGLVTSLEDQISNTVAESDISRLNSQPSAVLADDAYAALSDAVTASIQCGGAYDPSLGALVELWNITGDDPRVPSDGEIAAALSHCGADKLTLDGDFMTAARSDEKLKIDLGGAGKGYVCQKATELLASKGGYGIVSFGSSIGVFGSKPDGSGWNIAITDPYDPASTIGYVTIPYGYISVSGDYERYAEIDGKRYCHIFDPATGRPVDNGVHSVVVWTGDGEAGDVISTALFVTGEDGIDRLRTAGLTFEAMIISDCGVTMTDGMREIFTENDG